MPNVDNGSKSGMDEEPEPWLLQFNTSAKTKSRLINGECQFIVHGTLIMQGQGIQVSMIVPERIYETNNPGDQLFFACVKVNFVEDLAPAES